jgi:KUP system potassium uptake protein
MTEDPADPADSAHPADGGEAEAPPTAPALPLADGDKAMTGRYLAYMALGAIGVVFGDIGTSPLYAVREVFHGPHAIALTDENVLGVLSLVWWSLFLVISVKYLLYVLRADNKGEGGALALMALAAPGAPYSPVRGKGWSAHKTRVIVLMGLFGAALLYGDGIITPAITVLGAIEGLEIATPVFSGWTQPLAIMILAGVFLLQSRGTARLGALFGPIISVWFLALSVLGIYGITKHPGVLAAFNPIHAVRFFANNQGEGFLALGVIVLVVTGGEALYADMGHFGRKPIRLAWYALVLPSLVLNYMGQGALLLDDPSAADNPFFRLAPSWALYPLVGLATAAAVIAAQALISGTYSLTRQAVSLGYLPRMRVAHTSKEEIGQIYVPLVNWMLLLGCVMMVLFFQTSSNMAAAYGIAVTSTMVLTTAMTFFVSLDVWKWRLALAIAVTAPFMIIDLAFFGASMVKVAHGGWVPLLVACGILAVMTTWRRGRSILASRLHERAVPITDFAAQIKANPPLNVPGTAVYMTSALDGAPTSLVSNVRHNKVIHEHVVLMTVMFRDTPYVPREERYKLTAVDERFWTLQVSYGFMDSPNVPAVLMRVDDPKLALDLKSVTYFLGRETVLATSRPGMAIWRERLFSFMSRNAQRATTYFRIPSDHVIEIGIQIEL